MTHYSIERRDRIFVKQYRLLSIAKNINKNLSNNFSRKYSEKLFDHAKK